MRALFLIPGGNAQQLQAFAAVAAVAEQLKAQVHVVCQAASLALWKLQPAVEKVVAFPFEEATLADWANLLGTVREPDFQLCVNRAQGRQVDLMLSMSHIPTRVALKGFSATAQVKPSANPWPNQAWEAFLKPVGVHLDAQSYRLALPKAELQAAAKALPAGDGPALLLAPAGDGQDWPLDQWQALPQQIRAKLANLRVLEPTAAGTGALQRAALMANADVVLASDPAVIEWALLLGLPLVALGRAAETLPQRPGLQALGLPGQLKELGIAEVMAALGLG
ncbi:glycosyltransferase family 9 protein [Cyanobium sp. WAJ14-Wanaka]|uniref:glycosyltransferase family 9 protein n=1 Tax=Cyanobium sp. WAJ14-Wanaka TaxID=2823725 RepID=UPI0020CC3742|nr:lipopolysaccharide heptosyltransferase family protein [Cyanobium sp. WAJ14-Wanaka]MCP9774151.1 lipopolysaccharide heptosyltransferase family protein [Cyanobium sp. WAJ14-Wanaka]